MRKFITHYLKFSGFILLSFVLLTSCSKKEETAPVPEAARPVRVMRLQGVEQGVTRVYPAKTDAQDTVDASFEIPGRIIELPVSRGTKVEKDQILAKIDPRDYENERDAKKAEFVKAQAELERYRKLYEEDVVSLQEFQIHERNMNVTEANLKTAEKAFQDTVLKAPFAGIVATKYVDNFQSVLAKSAVVRIQNNDAIQVVINVPERDMAYGGQDAIRKADVSFDSFPGRKFDLTFKDFETEADPVTQTFKVKFIMPNPSDLKILPGMSATVTLSLKSSAFAKEVAGFVIPSAAVTPGVDGESFVWTVDLKDQTVHKRGVLLGEMRGSDSVQIASGLQAGDVIAVSGIYHLQEGMKIQPKELGTEMVK